MPPWLEHLTPRASRRQHLFLAALLWSVVGAVLFLVGCRWVIAGATGATRPLLVALALGVGLAKGRFVLDRTARRITGRILERGDDRCLGGFLSWKSWLLIAAMSASGRLLRGSHLPPAGIGTLYAAIGTGLVFSSRIAWRQWRAAGKA
jgi:hypothetical protein